MDEVKAPVPPDAWQRVWVSYDDEGFFSAPRTEKNPSAATASSRAAPSVAGTAPATA